MIKKIISFEGFKEIFGEERLLCSDCGLVHGEDLTKLSDLVYFKHKIFSAIGRYKDFDDLPEETPSGSSGEAGNRFGATSHDT